MLRSCVIQVCVKSCPDKNFVYLEAQYDGDKIADLICVPDVNTDEVTTAVESCRLAHNICFPKSLHIK